MFLLCSCGKEGDIPYPTDTTSTTHTTTISTNTTTTAESTYTETRVENHTTTVQDTPSINSSSPETHSSKTNITSTSTTAAHTTVNTNVSSTQTHITSTTISTTVSPTDAIFKATVRDVDKHPISGVIVSVWSSADIQIGFATTDKNGVALITVPKQSAYRVKLTPPAGYEADAEYRFATTTVNITLRKAAIQNELDHSQAQYAVGKTMTNFSLEDTDGNTYQLTELLKTNKLVILDFWYTTCEPCKQEFPFFEAAMQEYGEDIALLAIDPIDSMSAITALRNQLNSKPATAVSFPMLKDTCNLALGFHVMSYPVTVFIDANGRIMEIHTGAFSSQAHFLSTIAKYVG